MTAVAIDGPAGAGKSTVARAVADELGFTYVDTGAMYRAIALRVLEYDIDPTDAGAVSQLASTVHLSLADGAVMVDGRDVTDAIRTEVVTQASARIARHPGVREALVAIQRRLAAEGDVVMEGRDIGTKVLPNADVKIFLTASLDERTSRRAQQTGVDEAEIATLKVTIEERDRSDMERDESPLVQAADAVVVDSTDRPIANIVNEIASLVKGAAS